MIHGEEMLALDTETTGVDVFNDRIVTVFLGVLNSDGTWGETLDLLINPGVEIPEGASNVHGITTEKAQAEGMNPKRALYEVGEMLWWHSDLPLVVMNASFDLTLLREEFERYQIRRFPFDKAAVYDPLVMDRHHDRYRRGSRKLVDLAHHYGVTVEEEKAHAADYDCYLAGSVTRAILSQYGDCSVQEQAQWYEAWRANFEKYLQKSDPTAIVEGGWPLREKEGS